MRCPSKPRRLNRRRAFTLIEVLLVLTILVILAGFAVTQFSGIQEGANRSAAQTQIGLFGNAIRYYHNATSTYPEKLDDLIVSPGGDIGSRWTGPYLEAKEIPLDPWFQTYRYQVGGKNNPDTFDLWSVGADKQDGTDDDIGNW